MVVADKMKKAEIEIKGMSCSGCAKRIESSLSEIKGIQDVRVSVERNKAFVEVSDDVDEGLLRHKIKEAGYEAGEVKFE